MTHLIWKNGFHGDIEVTFRGPTTSFELSPAQARKWVAALCPSPSDCMCAGNYGTGYEGDSARITYDDVSESYWLIPALTYE